jgi:TonB family protein
MDSKFLLILMVVIVLTAIAAFLFFKSKKAETITPKDRKNYFFIIGLLIATNISTVILSLIPNQDKSKSVNSLKNESSLKEQITSLEEKLAISLSKTKEYQTIANQAKVENELSTTNILNLQEELLRRNDEFNLLKEELDLRYKVDANKLLKANEDKIRKSARAEAQKIIENNQLEAKIKFAKKEIESSIVSKWNPPKDKHNLVVVVEYTMDAKGVLTSINLVQPSGTKEVDDSVINAIRAASPFPVSNEESTKAATQKMTSKFILP